MQAVRARAGCGGALPMVALTAYVPARQPRGDLIRGPRRDHRQPIPLRPGFRPPRSCATPGGPQALAEPEDVAGARGAGEPASGARWTRRGFAALLEVAGRGGGGRASAAPARGSERGARALDAAVADGDTPLRIRAQTHILIAISGAVGARGIHPAGRGAEHRSTQAPPHRRSGRGSRPLPRRSAGPDRPCRHPCRGEIGQPPPGMTRVPLRRTAWRQQTATQKPSPGACPPMSVDRGRHRRAPKTPIVPLVPVQGRRGPRSVEGPRAPRPATSRTWPPRGHLRRGGRASPRMNRPRATAASRGPRSSPTAPPRCLPAAARQKAWRKFARATWW